MMSRLRRRLDPESSAAWIVDRIAGSVANLYLIVTPSAAEIVSLWAPGDDDAIDEAIRIVDQRWRDLQTRLGRKPA